jgi:anti-sigma factor RsiW
MKDDLHELIDGGLPDEHAAELLHLLSVDPEKRSMFRQQMRLQKSLGRNERHAAMSSLEEHEMLNRISRVVGEPAPSAGRFARRGIVMLAVGFLVGSGAGYLGHSLVASPSMAAQPSPDTIRVVEQVPVTEPQVVNINRDSVVNAIRDSLVAAQKASAAASTPKRTPKKKTRPSWMRGNPTTGGVR